MQPPVKSSGFEDPHQSPYCRSQVRSDKHPVAKSILSSLEPDRAATYQLAEEPQWIDHTRIIKSLVCPICSFFSFN